MVSISTLISREDDLIMFLSMLESVAFADEIVIYNFKRDAAELKKATAKYHPKIVEVMTLKIVEQVRARQVREATGEWVLIMDYDEIITPDLKNEIVNVTSADTGYDAYMIKRKNYSLGFPVSHGGFGDDAVHRLFCRSAFLDWPTDIHSTPRVKGKVGVLAHPMEHHKDASISQMVAKTDRYTDIEARQFLNGGLPPVTAVTLIRKPVMEFIRRYFLKQGFLDGRIGILQAIYQSYSVFITYAKLFELQQKNRDPELAEGFELQQKKKT